MPLDIGDPNTWDDSALILAYQAAVDAHKPANASFAKSSTDPQPSSKRRSKQKKTLGDVQDTPATAEINSNAETNSFQPSQPPQQSQEPQKPEGPVQHLATASNEANNDVMRIPPPPPSLFGASVTPEIEKLLMAWYEAGYRAGFYAASHQSAR